MSDHTITHPNLGCADMTPPCTKSHEESWESWEIVVGLSDAIDRDLEGWLDFISERANPGKLITDIDYKVVGCTFDGSIRLRVTGNPLPYDDA